MSTIIKRAYLMLLITAFLAGCGNVDEIAVSGGAGGGLGGDTTPPTVLSTSPINGATNVSINTTISATFSELMDSSTITVTSFTVSGGVTGTVTPGTTATFTPDFALSYATTYTVTLDMTITDFSGNALAAPYTWTFTTAAAPDTTPPTVSSALPTGSSVAITDLIAPTFSEPIDCATFTASTVTISPAVTGNFTCTGSTATPTFDPTPDLAYSTTYTVTIKGGTLPCSTCVKDVAGNPLAGDYLWTFTTAAAPDTTPPTVSSTSPTNGATNVRVIGQTFTVTFSESMDCTTVTTSTVTIVQQPATPVTLNRTSCSGATAVFAPVANYTTGFNYTGTVVSGASGVKDVAGNPLVSDYSWSFTTTTDTTAPSVSSTTPADTATGVAVNTNITVVFNENIDCATITLSSFKLEATSVPGTPIPAIIDSCSGSTAVLNPSSDLSLNTNYTGTVTTGVTDAVGNPLGANYTWSFTTTP